MAIVHLKNMPEEIRKYILLIQGNVKANTGRGKYSLESTIYKIIKEHQYLTAKK